MLQSNTSNDAHSSALHTSKRISRPDVESGCICRDHAGVFARESVAVGQYKCLDHERDYSNVGSNVELLIAAVVGQHDYRSEGLSTVNYSVVSEELKYVSASGADPGIGGVAGSHADVGAHETRAAARGTKSKRSRARARLTRRMQRGPKRYPYTHIKVDF